MLVRPNQEILDRWNRKTTGGEENMVFFGGGAFLLNESHTRATGSWKETVR